MHYTVVSGQLHNISFTSGEQNPSTHWRVGPVGPTAGLDSVESRKNLCNCQEVNSDHSPFS